MTTRLRASVVPLAHYLPYWWLDKGLLVNVDGSFAMAWEVETVDGTCLTNASVNAKDSALRRAMNLLPAGYHLQWLRRSRLLRPSFFDDFLKMHRSPDAIFREQRALAADAMRARGLRHVETYCVLVRPYALGRLGSAANDPATSLLNGVLGRRSPLSVTLAQHETARHETRGSGAEPRAGRRILGRPDEEAR